ncbi:MAG: class I SAM-dependent methyltransferase [Minisyncoccia bacterium]
MEILVTEKSKDYELLDSGEGEKLERYGQYVLRRPDPQVLWAKSLSKKEWEGADSTYVRSGASGKWLKPLENWQITLEELTFNVSLLPSKHLGVFPEQVGQWKWLEGKIKRDTNIRIHANNTNRIKVLNLFAYTGGATMACARAGAEVYHIDSSKFAVDLARKNLKDSGLEEKPVRFIVDDVRKFVEREIKRGNKYDVILLDPPVYGKGVKKEVWKIENDLLPFLKRVKSVLSKDPIAIVLNGYASNYSAETYKQVLEDLTKDLGGKTACGELSIKETNTHRLLTAGIFARWFI